MKQRLALALTCVVACRNVSAAPPATIAPTQLRCEYQESPLAIQSPHPRFSWLVTESAPNLQNLSQTAYRLIVGSSQRAVETGHGDLWDFGRIPSAANFQIAYAGKPLQSQTLYYWSVKLWDANGNQSPWSPVAEFTTGLLNPADWTANWVRSAKSQLPGQQPPLPLFRKQFQLTKPVARALASISGLGQYELRVNGTKAGDAELQPGWTNYKKTIFYNTYDVTRSLLDGQNVLGVLLGNGMYNVEETEGRYTKFAGSFGQPKLICQLKINYVDGTSATILSDSSWRTHPGPITFSSTYGGEDFDARLEPPGWDRPDFDDSHWEQTVTGEGPGGQLISQLNPEIKQMGTYQARLLSAKPQGIKIYDLGQNFAGWPQIVVRGKPGATVKLIPGELLDANGFVSQHSSGAPQWFSYTLLGGKNNETWHPRFSYYGFRYVEAHTQGAEIVSLTGQAIHSSAQPAGTFTSSSPLLNNIHKLILEAIRNNLESVLTDCPHREKLGWLEESHLLGNALMYDFNLARLYEKIARDIHDSQTPDGLVPDIAPEFVQFEQGFRDSPEWGSAAVLDPWLAYQHYANRAALAGHFEDMKRYVDYLQTKAENGIVSYGLGDWYDIGPKPPGVSQLTGLGVTATAVYYQDLVALAKIAAILGKHEEQKELEQRAASERDAFNAKYFNPAKKTYERGSQTDLAMPLSVGLVPDEYRQAVLDHLVEDIRAHNNHVTAGDVGFHYVVDALTTGGRSDVLYDMLSRTDPPSYGAQLAHGATALTEAWDANPDSSQDHFMLGHAEEWFYRGLAGIDFNLTRPIESAKGAAARRQTEKEHRSPSGGALDSATVLREFLGSAKAAAASRQAEQELASSWGGAPDSAAVLREFLDSQIVIKPSPVGNLTSVRASYDSVYGTIVSDWKRTNGQFTLDVTIPPNAHAQVFLPGSTEPRSIGSGQHHFAVQLK